MTTGFPGVPDDALVEDWGQFRRLYRRVSLTVNRLLVGKTNNVKEVTLTANQTTTVVTDPIVGVNSWIRLMPLTANARTEEANDTVYISSQANTTFTITHANAASTDRDFRYVVIG